MDNQMMIDQIMIELNGIYQAVSSIPVTGDAVDTMATVRARLRKVYADVKKLNEEGNSE